MNWLEFKLHVLAAVPFFPRFSGEDKDDGITSKINVLLSKLPPEVQSRYRGSQNTICLIAFTEHLLYPTSTKPNQHGSTILETVFDFQGTRG